jgi:inosine/xanthosine triphosphatase
MRNNLYNAGIFKIIYMKIKVGTMNKGKIEAVQMAVEAYDILENAAVEGAAVESGVNAQPIGLEEILQGAMNRARLAYESGECDLGFGLESGIFPAPFTKSDYFDTCACAIYDGRDFHLGMSSCFEYPPKMIEKVLREGKEITEAALDLGFSEDKKFSEGQGMIGILTRGRVSRIKYSYQAVQSAMIHLENSGHYTAK